MVYFLRNISPIIYSQVINPKIKFKVDPSGLKRDIVSSVSRLNNSKTVERNLKDSSGKLLVEKIEQLKNQMVKDFINHPVTKEIMGGVGASNISGTLSGYGNLFTFIGFNSSDQPIQPIIELLNRTNYHFSKFNTRGQANILIEMPSAEQIFAITPLPWAPGISWAQRIEVGLPGFGQYMNTYSDKSRSTAGIQTDNQIRGGGFKNVPYVSSFINNWSKKFRNITSTKVLQLT